MRNKDHPVLAKQKLEQIKLQFCPRCETEFFLTDSEFMEHLEEHKRKHDPYSTDVGVEEDEYI